MTKDAPKGWIKLKTTKRTIYFDASRIAALGDVTNATALAAEQSRQYTP